MSAMAGTVGQTRGMSKDEKFVIFASSLGTIFEWYDFYLYAVLAPFFAALFFPAGNDTAALLSAFATYAAGFLVRPFGAVIFGRIGDLVGRKYTFLVTIMVMGSATFLVGVLPTYAAVGWLAPILLVTLRLCQGLALGGEYGGAATYVAEHARPHERGYATSWIQTTATNTAGRRPMWPNTRGRMSAAMRPAGSRPRPLLACCWPSLLSPVAANGWTPRSSRNGDGAFRSSFH